MTAGLLSQLLNGLQYGLLLFLIASGLTLVFGVLGVINLAHGSLFMIGAYLVYGFIGKLGSIWLALPVTVICGLAIGAVLERYLFRHFYDREHLDQVLLTFSLVLIFEELRSLLAGNDFHSVPVPDVLDFSLRVTSDFSYSAYRLFVIFICVVIAVALFIWIERTKMGAVIRAAAEKPEIVDILGIDARRIHLIVFAIGAALAVAAGGLAAPLTSVYPNMGGGLLIMSFVVVVVGGLGSVTGAFWAALLIGCIDTLGKAYGAQLLALPLGPVLSAIASMSVYIVMVAILLFRPTGLRGRRA